MGNAEPSPRQVSRRPTIPPAQQKWAPLGASSLIPLTLGFFSKPQRTGLWASLWFWF